MIRKSKLIRDNRGVAAITIAIALFAIIGVASLAIDMGQLYTTRNELQNVADAAALAGVAQLVQDQGGQAVRNSDLAKQTALQVAQTQSGLDGLPTVPDASRNDLEIHFGVWNIYAGNPSLAWTDLGTSVLSDSNANAMQVTIKRSGDTIFGPVSTLFAKIFGVSTSNVSASAIAYLGYTNEVQTGGVQVPLALPSNVLTACNGHSSWFARLFAPREAVASATKTYVFRDTGGGNVNTTVTTASPLDPTQAYLFTVGKNDSVPGTIWDILTKIYTPSYNSSNPLYVTNLKLGQQIYARSEFKYGTSYIGPIFQRLQKAYNYKTTGNANTAPPAGTVWRVTFAVYGTTPNPLASRYRKTGFMSLARLLGLFGPSAAYACYTMPPPNIYVNGFVNADITGVTYNGSCDNCNYTFPKTIGGVKYTDKKDCLNRYPSSVWNQNTVTVQNVTDASTVSPPGSLSGGPSNNVINNNAPENVGAIATVPRLVK
jgi:Flp pilus assembly protein TadG